MSGPRSQPSAVGRCLLLGASLLTLLLCMGSSTAQAANDVPKEEYDRALAAIDKGDIANAIIELESLADSGVVHPDVSYNRGIAYATRAQGAAAEPGDLGRAAAAFEEAVRLRPNDKDADKALDMIRGEVTRRRSKQDKKDVIVRTSLGTAVLELLPVGVWSLAAMGASLLAGIGLLLRWRKSGWIHVVGAVLTPLSLVLMLALIPIAYLARDHEETTKPGVLVVPEAALEQDNGKATDAPNIPEASLVELGRRKDDKVFVRWGNYEGWLPWRAVRPLAVR